MLAGLKFEKVNNKTLRLYFEKQFSQKIEEEEMPYVNHVFELKVKLFYGKHYDTSNLLNIHEQLSQKLDNFPGKGSISDMFIEEINEADHFLLELCKFHYYTLEPDYDVRFKCMNINEKLRLKDNIFKNLNNLTISEVLIQQIKTIDCVNVFIWQNSNPTSFFFAFNKIIEPYAANLHKIKVYQVNLSIIDQEIYLVLAKYLENNKDITIIKVIGKTMDEIIHKSHLEYSHYNNNSRYTSQAISNEESQYIKMHSKNKSQNYQHFQGGDKGNSKRKKFLLSEEEKPIFDGEKQLQDFITSPSPKKKNKKQSKHITKSIVEKPDNKYFDNMTNYEANTNINKDNESIGVLNENLNSNNKEINLNIQNNKEEKLEDIVLDKNINLKSPNSDNNINNDKFNLDAPIPQLRKKVSNLRNRKNEKKDSNTLADAGGRDEKNKYVSIKDNNNDNIRDEQSNSENDNNNDINNLDKSSSHKPDSDEEDEGSSGEEDEENQSGDEDFSNSINNFSESGVTVPNNESIYRTENLNKSNFIIFYEVLAKRHNLLELNCLLFIKENHLILLSHVLNSNRQLRRLQLRNMLSILNANDNEIDLAYHFYNSLGPNIKDEFFIFFNEINQLKNLEKLKLTHFSFNSDINYLACQSALQLPNLLCLDLTSNQGVVNNYLNVEENYNLSKSNLKKINFGNIYFHMIRNFDFIIHPEKMKIAEMGVFDSISLSAFLHYCNQTQLEKIKLTLNKPCGIDTLELLLKILAEYIFQYKNLKYFYIKNTYTDQTYQKFQDLIREWVKKLFYEKFRRSSNLRKLSFNHKKRATYIVNDRMYLKQNNIIIRFLILFVLQNRFKSNFDSVHKMFRNHISLYPDKKDYYEQKFLSFKENILKKIILLESGKPKKMTI